MRIKTAAKINLALDVTGRLPDGYHLIESVFQSVGIYDDVTVELTDSGISVSCDVPEDFAKADPIPCDERNIAYKAAKLFFEETGYTIVLFEDIDRFKDTQIFAKLRELNLILNSAKQIGQKPIRFIYALRDNVFTGTERVKFFDFILPIVPKVSRKIPCPFLRLFPGSPV